MGRDLEPEFRGTDRFYLERRLGAGGMGVVYRAHDRERDEYVALKLLSNLSPGELYRFKREFRSLVDVVHPNLVVVYELFSDAGNWFFTMELVTGMDFLEYVRDGVRTEHPIEEVAETRGGTSGGLDATVQGSMAGADSVTQTASQGGLNGPLPTVPVVARRPPGKTANMQRLRVASTQLAAALLQIHQTGHLHRDIKPSNILVTSAGRVVVLDYGVISAISASRGRHESSEVGGTPAYQAPEVFDEDHPADAASDWYSFGTMLYEALVGWRPFSHYGSKEERAGAKQQHAPLAPSELRPGVPEDLDGLCMDLLQRDPAARPSGEEVLRRLGLDDQLPLSSVDTGPSFAPMGRDAQLEQLRETFAQVRQGRGRVVFLRGLSGMGKSTIASHFLDEIDEALIFEGRCYERESLPYKALDSVVDALAGYLLQQPNEVVQEVLPADLVALARVFPVLRRVPTIAEAMEGAVLGSLAPELRRRAFSALRELMVHLGEERPLVIYVDDLQWGDAESAPLFFELMRPPTPRVLLLGSYRSEESQRSALLRRLLSAKEAHEPFRERLVEIDVDELPSEVAIELAGRLLDEAGGGRALVERVAADAAGSPYFIRELVQYVATHGAESFERMTLESMILERYAQLSLPAQRLLQVVAVAGWRLLQSVALEAADLDAEGQRVMAELRAGHFVRTAGVGDRARIEAYHDCVREALTSHLDAGAQRAWHAQIAEALQNSREVLRPEHVYALANHRYRAGSNKDAARVFDLNLRAGLLAKESHAYEQAFTYLFQAAEVAERAGLGLDVEFEQLFGQVSASAGRVDTAVKHFERALSRTEEKMQRVTIHSALARIHVGRMDLNAANHETAKGLAELDRPPVRKGMVDALGALRAWRRGRVADEDPAIFGSATREEREFLRLEVGLYKYTALITLFALEPLKMLKATFRTYEPAVRMGLSPEYVEFFVMGAAVTAIRRLKWAAELEQRAQHLAEELNDPVTTARTKLYLSIAAHGLGKTQLAVERAEDCLGNHGTWLENVDFLTGVADLCWNLNMRGHAKRSWHWLQQGLQRATLTGSESQLTDGHSYRSYAGPALTMIGRFDEAKRQLAHFRTELREPAEDEWRWGQYLAHLALALVLQGEFGEKLEEVLEARQKMKLSLRRIPLQLKQFHVAQAYGRLEQYRRAEEDQRSNARRAAQRALKELRRVSQQETLLAHLGVIEAGFHAHEGQSAKALAALQRAELLARQTDNPWVQAECSVVRARMAKGRGAPDHAERYAREAWQFSHDLGWQVRADAIVEEFALSRVEEAE